MLVDAFVGTLKSATVSPRDVFRYALSDHAAAVILFHNHPSGDSSPSPQDLADAFALAALRLHGYRADKRFIVFQVLPHPRRRQSDRRHAVGVEEEADTP